MLDRQFSHRLDALRGYSALVVLIAHLCAWFVLPITGRDERYAVLSALSFYAVLVFFVLSGYLITHSLMLNQRKNGSINVGDFLSARALRILPPFAFAMLLSVGVSILVSMLDLHGHISFRLPTDVFLVRESLQLVPRDVVYSLLLSNGVVPGTNSIITNGALWSLSIEVWLYGIALLVALAWEGRFREKTALTASVGLVGVLLVLSSNPLVLEFGVYWVLGAAFRIMMDARNKKWWWIGLVGVAVPGILICLKNPARLDPANQWVFSTPINLSVLIVLSGLLRLIPRRFGWWQGPGCFLAPSSYTLYIIHFPILALLFSVFHIAFVTWGWGARVSFLCGAGVFILVVSHFAALILEDRALWRAWIKGVVSKLSPARQRLTETI